jgi:hypothetical protein
VVPARGNDRANWSAPPRHVQSIDRFEAGRPALTVLRMDRHTARAVTTNRQAERMRATSAILERPTLPVARITALLSAVHAFHSAMQQLAAVSLLLDFIRHTQQDLRHVMRRQRGSDS